MSACNLTKVSDWQIVLVVTGYENCNTTLCTKLSGIYISSPASRRKHRLFVFHRFFLSVVYLPQKLKKVAGLKSLPVWNEKLKDLLWSYMPNWLPVLFAMFYIFASFKQIWITKYTGFVEVTIFTIEWQGRSKLESNRVKTNHSPGVEEAKLLLGRLN